MQTQMSSRVWNALWPILHKCQGLLSPLLPGTRESENSAFSFAKNYARGDSKEPVLLDLTQNQRYLLPALPYFLHYQDLVANANFPFPISKHLKSQIWTLKWSLCIGNIFFGPSMVADKIMATYILWAECWPLCRRCTWRCGQRGWLEQRHRVENSMEDSKSLWWWVVYVNMAVLWHPVIQSNPILFPWRYFADVVNIHCQLSLEKRSYPWVTVGPIQLFERLLRTELRGFFEEEEILPQNCSLSSYLSTFFLWNCPTDFRLASPTIA